MKEDTSIKTAIGVIVMFLALIMIAALLKPSARQAEADRKEAERKYNDWVRHHSIELRTHFESHPHHRFNFEKTSQYCDTCKAIKLWSN